MAAKKFSKPVPDSIKRTTRYLERKYYLGLSDAFDEAIRMHMSELQTSDEIYLAWYYHDYRAFIPTAYLPEWLNFDKHPLTYESWISHSV